MAGLYITKNEREALAEKGISTMQEYPCGAEILLDGKPFGQIHHWAKDGEICGASVHLTEPFRSVRNDSRSFLVTHVFLPEELPTGFTIRRKTRAQEFEERAAPAVAEAMAKLHEKWRAEDATRAAGGM